jgi:hypothetical protein
MQRELQDSLGLQAEDFDTHESDLYVIDTPEVRAWLKTNYKFYTNCTFFVCQRTGRRMIDIPFANDAFWEKVGKAIGI